MAPEAWFAPDVDWGRFRAVVTGYDDHTFRGDEIADRRDAVDMLWGLMAAPVVVAGHPFTDVSVDDPAVSWAAATAVVSGYADGTFRAAEPVHPGPGRDDAVEGGGAPVGHGIPYVR